MTPVDPSPQEIAEACERIRAGWSEAELRKRSAWMFTGPVGVMECDVHEDEATGAN